MVLLKHRAYVEHAVDVGVGRVYRRTGESGECSRCSHSARSRDAGSPGVAASANA